MAAGVGGQGLAVKGGYWEGSDSAGALGASWRKEFDVIDRELGELTP